jgi:phenylacetate-coenzyme A ligase PaaK-like adenylate-forming protein
VFLPGPTPYTVAALLKKSLPRIGVETLVVGVPDNIQTAIAAAAQADCLVGLAATMIRLARTEPSLRPSSVLMVADYVPQSVVKAGRELWHCAALTHYGMTETCYSGGVQCMACEGHHLRDSDIYIEIIDPKTLRPVPDGEWGEIVVTTFTDRAMPLFRYRTGDISRMIAAPCACGGTLRRLGQVKGRIRSDVTLQNGSTLSIHALDEWLFQCAGVIDYRAALSGDRLHLSVEGDFDMDAVTSAIPARLGLKVDVAREDCPVDIRASVQKRKLLVQPS